MLIKQFWDYPEYQILDGQGFRVKVRTNGKVIECTDLNSGYWQYLFGYRHPEFLQVLGDPDSHRPPSVFTSLHPEAEELGQLLSELTGYHQVLFLTSGTSAVDAALRMVDRIHPGKKIVSLKNGFHGSSATSLSAAGFDWLRSSVSFIHHERFLCLPANQEGWQKIESLAHDNNLGGVIFEPVQGVGGCEVVPGWWLQQLSRLRRERDFFIIADEISSFARIGYLFAFQAMVSEEHNSPRSPSYLKRGEEKLLTLRGAGELVPDILCLGKGISGGYFPVSLVLATDEVVERHERAGKFYYGTTLAGTSLACRLVKTTLRLLQESGFERIRKLGDGIETSAKEHTIPLRGLGGIMRSIDCRTSARAKEISKSLLENHQFFTIPEGRYLMLMPPVVVPESEMQRFFSVLQ